MEEAGKIVVFQAFDTLIQANLVKTKLDAYGIPCFLTDENFVNLYPIRNEIFPGIRLHIFESDIDRVSEILKENLTFEKENHLKCPRCHSLQVQLKNKKVGLLGWTLALFTLLIWPQKRIFECQACENTFDYPDS